MFILKTLVHACLVVVLAFVGSVGKDCSNLDFRIQRLENLVVFEQHWHRLDGKERVELAVEGRFVEVVEDELRNLGHPLFVEKVHVLLTFIILNEEA